MSVARASNRETASQQRDNLCGPFHAARVLADAGRTEWEGAHVDQDLVALHAGTTLPERPVGPQVPHGASSLLDYRYPLPLVDPDHAGTAPRGLAGSIALLSGQRLECVPLRGRWSGQIVERLLDAAPSLQARLIANIRTGLLWTSRPPVEALLAVLAGAAPPDVPPAEWDVGHFVELLELIRGRGGALVVVRDSYPSIGWNAHHLQPAAVIATALMRGDGREGGVLAVVPAGGAQDVRGLASELSLEPEFWDNSTQEEAD